MEIVKLLGNDTATVQQGAIQLEANISLLEDPQPGDFVIVHAGFAIEKIDLEEAEKRIEMIDAVVDAPEQ
jgi:hydrogenase expression/formation protein HypC